MILWNSLILIFLFKLVNSEFNVSKTIPLMKTQMMMTLSKPAVELQWLDEPENATVVLGNTVRIHCIAVGLPSPSVTWQKLAYKENATEELDIIHTYSSRTLVISDAKEADGGAYLCQANNGIGEGLSKIIYLQVLVPPRFIFSDQGIVTHEGKNNTLICHVIGDSPITISWQKNNSIFEAKSNPRYLIRNTSMENETISELHIFNATRSDSGKYTCVAISDIGRDETVIHFKVRHVIAEINEPNPLLLMKTQMTNSKPTELQWIDEPKNATVVLGKTVRIHCIAVGTPAPSVTWQKFTYKENETEELDMIHTYSGRTLVISDAKEADAGAYICQANNGIGEGLSKIIYLQVLGTEVSLFEEQIRPLSLNYCGITLNFSNNSGAIHPCLDRENHMAKMRWYTADGLVTDVPGLRYVNRGGTLMFPPFDSKHFNKKIHQNIYQCTATTTAGREILFEICFNGVIVENKGPKPLPLMKTQMTNSKPTELQWIDEPENTTVVLGKSVRIDCIAVGLPEPNVTWQKLTYKENATEDLQTLIHTYSSRTLFISDAKVTDAGAYLCQANNGIGEGLSKIIHLEVLVPPRFKYDEQGIVMFEGENRTLICHVTGSFPITISWLKNGRKFEAKSNSRYLLRNIYMKNEMTSKLHIFNTRRSDTGEYTCVAVSDIGMDRKIIYLDLYEI